MSSKLTPIFVLTFVVMCVSTNSDCNFSLKIVQEFVDKTNKFREELAFDPFDHSKPVTEWSVYPAFVDLTITEIKIHPFYNFEVAQVNNNNEYDLKWGIIRMGDESLINYEHIPDGYKFSNMNDEVLFYVSIDKFSYELTANERAKLSDDHLVIADKTFELMNKTHTFRENLAQKNIHISAYNVKNISENQYSITYQEMNQPYANYQNITDITRFTKGTLTCRLQKQNYEIMDGMVTLTGGPISLYA